MRAIFTLFAILLSKIVIAEPLVLGRYSVSLNTGSRIIEIYYPPFIDVTIKDQELTLTKKKHLRSFGRVVAKTQDGVKIYHVLAVDSDGIDVSSKLVSFGIFSNPDTEGRVELISPKQPKIQVSRKLKLIAVKNVDKNVFQVIFKPEISKLIPGDVLRESLQIEGSGESIQVDVVGIYRG